MSRFFSEKYRKLVPYTPGEQPRDRRYIKLNTNESPFPPSPKAQAYAAAAAADLHLYPDPTCAQLTQALAHTLGIEAQQVILGNGSDEVLNYAFMAFCDDTHPAVFPDITYGFYKVFADINQVPYTELPLNDDLTVDVDALCAARGTIFIANPNAPTGIALPLADIEKLLSSDPDRMVVVDEAYVDFGADSAVGLIARYDNLLVTQTFSKSRSMAGGRLGMGMGSAAVIRDLNTVKYSLNPYNINRMTMAAGLGTLEDAAYFEENCRAVMAIRQWTTDQLRKVGFTVIDSSSNFIFAKHPAMDGGDLYRCLKERGILVRHFNTPRLHAYIRITIGSDAQMQTFIDTVKEVLL
ncbi:MAG: histidinol-phosphate transaminase [Clostridia bacterium]|nr:histidinol-phosphate transaminase [Clostridia bacterium]